MLRLREVTVFGESDCEAIGTGFLAQPTNALTSLVYLAAGGWLAQRLGRGPHPRPAGWAFAGLLAANGIGSFAYHGPQPAGAEVIHDVPAIGMLGVAVVVTADRIRHGRDVFPGRRPDRIATAAAALAVGGIANVVGRTGGVACDPASPWQPHGLWHVATAVGFTALGLLYFDDVDAHPLEADPAPTGADDR